MKLLFAFIVCLMAVSGGYAQAPSSTVGPLTVPGLKEELVKYGPFGNVLVYRAEDQPKQVMIFISGDGGFDKPFINMVKTTTQPGVMVIAVDINTYLKHMAKQKNTCTYAAADLEGLSQFMQGHYRYPTYRVPVIAGYSSGATMGYAALVQGPPNTFAGVISMGFCSDMTSPKPFCKGAGLSNKEGGLKEPTAPKSYNNYVYGRVSSTVAPWTALQGAQDQLCPADKASAFMSATGNATMVSVPAVGHGFLVGAKWQAEFHKAFNSIVAKQEAAVGATAAPQSLADLPLVEAAVASPKGKPLAVIVTGDGGWAGIDREIGGALNEQGLNVVGLNSLQYFWKPKTAEQMGKDMTRILAWYDAQWSPPFVVLVGYSQGADTLPFMVNRLPLAQQANIRTIALLGAGKKASFAFHMSDWLVNSVREDDVPIKPEADRMQAVAKLCFYGEDEAGDSLCPTLDAKGFTVVKTPGGHHFGGDYRKLAAEILATTGR